ncbi:MAG TPA: metabolite traffic protein EboE, partial [Verrucomicrobiae bacterium]|nr:metabolite traffic protein EboE [Verrucomicrobiae bacterium]
QVCPGKPYAIGLRLGAQAARELSDPATLLAFRQWLDRENCYVFTINGFPYGKFHGTRVKEHVYTPDWTTPERLAYTSLLFDLLAQIVPAGVEGSVSTVPCSYKEFITTDAQVRAMRDNLWRCVEHIATVSERSGRQLHLGLEPEPLCYLETSEEAVHFLRQMRDDRPNDTRLNRHLGVNYDTCHLAIEYEQPAAALRRFRENSIKISKIHLSSALKVRPTAAAREALRSFADDVYFHQVIARDKQGQITRFKDLDVALASPLPTNGPVTDEWRVHFHVPLHTRATELFDNTSDHVTGLLDLLKTEPGICSHFEMETYTWEVMPSEMKKNNVVDQLVAEYQWTLGQLARRGLA